MSVEIKHIVDRGNINKERLVLRITAADDIGRYALFKSTLENGSVTTNVSHTFWFPDQEVAVGDLVIIYTRAGSQSVTENKNGHKSYFYYWGLKKAVWAGDEDAIVLVEIKTWIHERAANKSKNG